MMYAVMRFGKSFTSMCCALEANAKLVLIVSGKKDVQDEWRRTVLSQIAEQIADISLSMKSEDYLEMPKVSYIYQQCPLEPKEMEAYRQFEEDFVMSSDTESITAQTAAALANKLIQFTGGTVYDDDKKAHTVSST